MRIAIGSDHAGFRYKEMFKARLTELGHEVKDFGTDSELPVDYPLFCHPVAAAVASGETERGIVLGGSGNGSDGCESCEGCARCAVLEPGLR